MPSVSKKQHGFMAAIANNPKFAKKVGVSKSVGEDYMKADKGRKFKQGGLKETDAESNPGLAKLPTEVRNKMGYMKKGGMTKMRKYAEGGEMMDENETEGGAYVGSRLDVGKSRGSRIGKVSKRDSDMIKKQDAETGMNKNPRMGGLAAAGMSAGLGSKYDGAFKKGGMAHEDKSKDKPMMEKVAKKAVKGHEKKMHGMKAGGTFRASANGIAQKGLTKGKMIGMKKGGAC